MSFARVVITEKNTRYFWACVERTPTCWLWAGRLTNKGYGNMHGREGGGSQPASRFSYALHFGDPGDSCVLHTCDNRACVRPEHLRLGTQKDNIRDMMQKGREGFSGERHWSKHKPDAILRGERNAAAKLSDAQVREIRASSKTLKALAIEFAVSDSTIKRARSRKTWAHVVDWTK